MIRKLVVVASGGALAFGLAGAVSPAMAMASVAHPASVTRANLPMPEGTPIIRDSSARLGGPGQLSAPDPPIVKGSTARPGCGHPGHLGLRNPPDPPTVKGSVAQNAPPTIRDAKARPGGAACGKLMNPSDTPIIRDSTAQFGDPDDGGHLFAALGDPGDGGQIHAAARLGDPDDGGEVTQAAARLGDPDDGGQVQAFAALGDPDDGGE